MLWLVPLIIGGWIEKQTSIMKMEVASCHGLTTILFSRETLAHWFRPTKQPFNPRYPPAFDVFLPKCAPTGHSSHRPHASPSQWKLRDNWPVASRELMGPALCQILTQKSSTLWIPLMLEKMDHSSTRHAPSTLSPPTRLHNRLYLVSQSWWGSPLSKGSLAESRNQPLTRPTGTIRHCSP